MNSRTLKSQLSSAVFGGKWDQNTLHRLNVIQYGLRSRYTSQFFKQNKHTTMVVFGRLTICKKLFLICILTAIYLHTSIASAHPYDPDDKEIAAIIPREGTFEAFYPREMYGIPNGASRAPHSHGSFFKYRHPALIESKNSAAFGYRFDGKRRFNFD